jgi:hypothetical protein
MSGFEVQWPKPNLAYNWMVKNGLFPSFLKVQLHAESLSSSLMFIVLALFSS